MGEAKRRSWKDLMKENQDREGSKTPPSAKSEEKRGYQGEGGAQEGAMSMGNQGEGTELVVYAHREGQWIEPNRKEDMQLDSLKERQTWKGQEKITEKRSNSYVIAHEMGGAVGREYLEWRPPRTTYDVDKQHYQGQGGDRELMTKATKRSNLQITQGSIHGQPWSMVGDSPGTGEVSIIEELSMTQLGEITEIEPVPGIGKDIVMQLELHEVRVQEWNYIVEPPDSPATSGEGTNMPTGLSPLIHKINLKRKYEEETET